MELKDLYGRREFDTRAIKAGAIEYVTCPTCGATPGAMCRLVTNSSLSEAIPDFAHIGRRFEYVEGRGLLFGEPTVIPPQIWYRCQIGRHTECAPHPTNCKCDPPDPCECPCHPKAPALKSSADVDDLLG